MSKFSIRSSVGSYTVEVGLGVADEAGDVAVALIDPVVRDKLNFPPEIVVPIEGSEESKTLASCERVLIAMKDAGLTRGELVAAVGGGVIQDVATLTSSLYMRGVNWVYLPTTLMAMADSCIGGKSSINVAGVKNLVGNFHPPTRILVDPRFIPTLPTRAIVSGLAEAVKICFVRGHESFNRFLELGGSRAPAADQATVEMLLHVLESKKWFVEKDEFDKAERQLLNFGHSFGHAWEAACGFSVQHGVGVAAGMLGALRHPAASRNDSTERLEHYSLWLLRKVREDVVAALAATDWATFRAALRADKKNSRGILRLVLPAETESVSIHELPMDDEQLSIAHNSIRQALEEVTA